LKILRISGVIFSILIFFTLTFIRSQPSKLFERNLAKQYDQKPDWGSEKYPQNINQLSKLSSYSYKWILNSIYTICYVGATYLLVFGLFPYKKVIVQMHYVYVMIFGLIVLFASIGLVSHRFDVGFGIVQYLKRLIQGLYLTMFFLIYFWKINPVKT